MFAHCLAQQSTKPSTILFYHIDGSWSQEHYASEEKKVEKQSAVKCLTSNFLLGLVEFMIILLATGNS